MLPLQYFEYQQPFLKDEYSPNVFKVNTNATTEYNRLICNGTFDCCHNLTVDE